MEYDAPLLQSVHLYERSSQYVQLVFFLFSFVVTATFNMPIHYITDYNKSIIYLVNIGS